MSSENVVNIEDRATWQAQELPNSTASSEDQPATTREWPTLDKPALHGLAGDIVRAIDPHTEADPAAILIQTLIAFGVHVGRSAHIAVEGDRHTPNLFALLVGDTSKARKGTSWGRVRQIFEPLPNWPITVKGLSSGEGLKWNVRDPVEGKGKSEGDPGSSEKRLLVIEAEFASALRATVRNGNTLSATIRECWDSGNLRTLTKNDPVIATDAHISIIGHITVDELRAELSESDRANGFANRFLFVLAKRSKVLPFGGGDFDTQGFTDQLKQAADSARQRGAIGMTPAARELWTRIYPTLSEGHAGMFGAVTARSEAQCLRLALLYSLLDEADAIDDVHLFAAVALWEYCEASARLIFGSTLGDPVADNIIRSLRVAGSIGLTRTEISGLFRRHQSAERISVALDLLRNIGLAVAQTQPTEGRPVEVWRATRHAK